LSGLKSARTTGSLKLQPFRRSVLLRPRTGSTCHRTQTSTEYIFGISLRTRPGRLIRTHETWSALSPSGLDTLESMKQYTCRLSSGYSTKPRWTDSAGQDWRDHSCLWCCNIADLSRHTDTKKYRSRKNFNLSVDCVRLWCAQ
jgi:hypothetical protein